jgi:hypothetical protein
MSGRRANQASQIIISPVKLLPRTWAWVPKMSFRKSRDSPTKFLKMLKNFWFGTYIKVKGKCVSLYRAVDSHGDTLNFMALQNKTLAFCTPSRTGLVILLRLSEIVTPSGANKFRPFTSSHHDFLLTRQFKKLFFILPK